MGSDDIVQIIALPQLAISFAPVALVLAVFYMWAFRCGTVVYAFARMAAQLILAGYVLAYLFGANHPAIIVAVLLVMMLVSGWITLRPLKTITLAMYLKALFAIASAGTATLLTITEYVIGLDPWFRPQYMIPLGGMVYANAMNTVSLAAERYESAVNGGNEYYKARMDALNAAMIPMINTLLAAGLVSLPGIMTGQVLSGVSPLTAVRYQIVIMCMIFSAGAGAAIIYLHLLKPKGEASHE